MRGAVPPAPRGDRRHPGLLPNFGDEKGVADTIKLSGLNVPILVQAYPDDLDKFTVERRRDAFCGKISVCNNLRQYGYPFTLTDAAYRPSQAPTASRPICSKFVGVCRVVNGLRKRPLRRGRRAARNLQHRPLQRETAAGVRHQRHHDRPLGDPRHGEQAGR